VAKADDFRAAIESKLKRKDFNFAGAYFPSGTADFASFEFENDVNFSGAAFKGEAGFSGATFKEGAYFSGVTFDGGADFSEATFSKDAYFYETTFGKVADFSRTTFGKVAYFSGTTFRESAEFWSLKTFPNTSLDFSYIVVEQPEQISFYETYLRPSWFVSVNAQKFTFFAVEWFRIPDASQSDADKLARLKLEDEIKALYYYRDIDPPQSRRMLSGTCWMLMNIAEDDRDYPTADEFRYWSMEALRMEGWRTAGPSHYVYWAVNGYGARPRRAFAILVALWIVFTVFYTVVGPIEMRALSATDFGQAINHMLGAASYSLAVMARLNPYPRPDPGFFQLLTSLEGILGPVQFALFVVAARNYLPWLAEILGRARPSR